MPLHLCNVHLSRFVASLVTELEAHVEAREGDLPIESRQEKKEGCSVM